MDYDTASPATEAPPPSRRRMDCPPDYIKTVPGILKIVQMVASILTFALSLSGSWGHLGGGWVAFVSISAFIHAVIWFVLHLINIVPDVLINFFVEVIGYCIWTIFFFISGIVAAVAGGRGYPTAGAAAFFAFACLGVYGADTAMQLLEIRRMWKERNDRRQVPTRAAEEDDLFNRPTA